MNVEVFTDDAWLGELAYHFVHYEEDEKSDAPRRIAQDNLHDCPGDDHGSHSDDGKEVEKCDEQGDKEGMTYPKDEKSKKHHRKGD